MNMHLMPYPGGFALVIEEGGRKLPLIDGKTGEIQVFSKREVHAWQYGERGSALWHTVEFLLEVGT